MSKAIEVQYVAVWTDADDVEHQTDPVPTRELAYELAMLLVRITPAHAPVGFVVTVGVA